MVAIQFRNVLVVNVFDNDASLFQIQINGTLERILIVRPDDHRFFSQLKLHGAIEPVFDQTPLLRERWCFACPVGISSDARKDLPLRRNEQC